MDRGRGKLGHRSIAPFAATTDRRAGRDWWLLRSVTRPAVPELPGAANPVDAFVRAKLAEKGWQPAHPVDRRALARRVYHDLLGLPPTFEQVEEFARDRSPDTTRG